MFVKKSKAELYQVRSKDTGDCAWGDIVLICGKNSVSVMITSDYGSFNYYWSNCAQAPKEFLCEIDFNSAMKKLTGGKLKISNPDNYLDEIKESVNAALDGDRITKAEAIVALEEFGDIFDSFTDGDLFFHSLYQHSLFEKIFGDTDGLPSSKVVDPCAVDFWRYIWVPFTEQLKSEL